MPKLPKPEVAYIGIDPGKSGGIAVLRGKEVYVTPMPETESDIWHWLQVHRFDAVAVIEKVSGYIGDKQPGSAMFTFGQGYGGLRMALLASAIPLEETMPQKWQKAMGLGSRKKTESKAQWKMRLRAKAQQLFPKLPLWSQSKTKGQQLAIADALLIAAFCKRRHEGSIE